MFQKFITRKPALAVVVLLACTSCNKNTDLNDNGKLVDDETNEAVTSVVLQNHSVTPSLIKTLPGFESLEVYSLISSDDTLEGSPNFIFGGSADGAGLLPLRNTPNGRMFTYVVNHEDNYAVSRIYLDETFKPVRGEYLLNSTGGLWRLCSATLAMPGTHGFGPSYLTCGESGEESRTHALNPLESPFNPAASKEVPALGRWNAENALPLDKNAFPGKTVIVLGDDDSGNEGGQVAMYLSETTGDLNNGSVYVLRRKDLNVREMDITSGNSYPVEFVKIDNISTLTGRQVNTTSAALGSIKFGRVEDVDYRRGNAVKNRELYFTVTGQNYSGTNADFSRTKYGRVYRLRLNATNPLEGTLEVVLDGDTRPGIADKFQNPDNICVTKNYVYVQEDANGYGDETHDAYIYQYNIATGELKTVFELDHRRTEADAIKYNPSGPSSKGSWEYGAMIDVSTRVGIPNTFMLCIQPHSWRGTRYKNPDGGTIRINEDQASQVVVIKGLPQ